MRIKLLTFGCKLNIEESEKIKDDAASRGIEIVEDDPDIVIINSCTVTKQAEKKVQKSILEYQRNGIYTVLTGCFRNELKADLVVPNDQKDSIIQTIMSMLSIDDETAIERYRDKTRAFLKIQTGCNAFCSYCIIPHVRGKSRSMNHRDILEQYSQIIEKGYKEVVLTGIHINSYGLDTGTSLTELIKDMKKIDDNIRLRLGSLEPKMVSDDLLIALSEFKEFCPHFHLSLQSGSDEVLKSMRRRYLTADYLDRVNKIREIFYKPAITTDIIVGFPSETEDDFKRTLEFVEKVKFSQIHGFSFSKREMTPAYSMLDLSKKVKSRRLHELIDLSSRHSREYINSFLNEEVDVLFERETGITKRYLRVKKDDFKRNQTIKRKVVDIVDNELVIAR